MADFTYVTAPYNKIYDTYIDEHEIVKIDEKQPKLGNTGILVAGDSNSQFMTFEINRYYDNIDLSDKFIKIFYIFTTEDGKIKPTKKNPIYSDDACNICYNDKKLRFSWLLPAEVALNSGKVAANISIIGEDNYSLNTTLFELEIQTSLTGNDITEATAKLSWISDIEARLYKVEQATGGVDLDYNTLVNKPKINGIELDGDTPISFVEQASASDLGGIKSLPKTEDQTQPVGIDEEGFLWVKPSSGGGGGGTGADGFSPIVSMTEEEGGTLLIIIDKNGPQTTHIKNGINGADGSSVTVTKDETIEGEHKIIFTDKDGEKEITIKDGSKVKISEEDGNIIEDNNGLYATVDEDAITENVKTALSNLYLALTGGTVKGAVNISVPNKVNNLFTVKRGTHDNTTLASFDGGHVVAGSEAQTGYCSFGSVRKCASDNNRVNSAAFYCNSDGTAIFTHKGGAIGVTGVQNDAWMKFNQNGFQVSYSGDYNKSATEAYTLLDSHNISNDATIKALEARIKALEDKG